MDDDEIPTFDGQFARFVDLLEYPSKDGLITLRKSDNWFHHANIFMKFKVSLTDSGYHFTVFEKWALSYDEYLEFIRNLCVAKNLDIEKVMDAMTVCGEPKEMVDPQKYKYLLEEEIRRLEALKEE